MTNISARDVIQVSFRVHTGRGKRRFAFGETRVKLASRCLDDERQARHLFRFFLNVSSSLFEVTQVTWLSRFYASSFLVRCLSSGYQDDFLLSFSKLFKRDREKERKRISYVVGEKRKSRVGSLEKRVVRILEKARLVLVCRSFVRQMTSSQLREG